MAEENVRIVVQLEATEALAQLRELKETMEAITAMSATFSREITPVTRAIQQVSRRTLDYYKLTADQIREIGRIVPPAWTKYAATLNDLIGRHRELEGSFKAITSATGYTAHEWDRLWSKLSQYSDISVAHIRNLQELQSIHVRLGPTLQRLGINLEDALSKWSDLITVTRISPRILVDTITALQQMGYNVDSLMSSIRATPETIQMLNSNIQRTITVAQQLGISVRDIGALFPDLASNLFRNVTAHDMWVRILSMATDTTRLSSEQYAALSRVCESLGIQIGELSTMAKGLLGVQQQTTVNLSQLGASLRSVNQFIQETGISWDTLNKVISITPEGIVTAAGGLNTFKQVARDLNMTVGEAIVRFPRLFRALVQGSDITLQATAMIVRGIDQMNRGFYLFSRQLFWVGLGTMFLVMAYDRMQRRHEQIASTALSLVRAEYNLYQQQKRLREIVQEYGPASEEARDAQRRLKLETLSYELSVRRAQQQVETFGRATIMFWASAAAQAIGSGSIMYMAFQQIGAGQRMVLVGQELLNRAMQEGITFTIQSTVSEEGHAIAKIKLAQSSIMSGIAQSQEAASLKILGFSLDMATIKTWALVIAKQALIGAATLGIGALIGWAVSAVTTAQATAEFNEQLEKMRRELNLVHYGGSPGLIDIIKDFDTLSINIEKTSSLARKGEISFRQLHRTLRRPVITQYNIVRGIENVEYTRRVYEEIKHVREGLGIHSPGLEIEIPELEQLPAQQNVSIGPIIINPPKEYTGIDRQRLINDVEKSILKALERRGI